MLIIAVARVANIINLGLPIATIVAPQGPAKLFMIKPRDRILSAFAAKT